MDVSASGSNNVAHSATQGMDKVISAEKPSRIDVAVAKHGLEAEKAAGAQMVDMIQKAGSIINVTI